MNIKIVELKAGHVPVYKHETDACADCMANLENPLIVGLFETVRVPLGFAVEIPNGWEGIIKGCSGFSSKGIISALGTIDAGYTGEVCAILTNTSKTPFLIHDGDRVCQFKVQKSEKIIFEKVNKLADSDRGSGGFGSTGV